MEVPIDWAHFVWRFLHTMVACCMKVPIDWDHDVWRFILID